ncbi:MAG: hypothetical protein J0H68_05425 [Sphingobacteriia bacterium]|nr:hypothetical protein [Sphingobacteriia bacterium]
MNQNTTNISEDILSDSINENNQKAFNSFNVSTTPNLVSNRYAIKTDQPLKSFSTQFGQAYVVEDKKTNSDSEFFAFVYDNMYVQRLDVITSLKDYTTNLIIKPIAAEITPINNNETFALCVIMKRPIGVSLREHIMNNGPVSEQFVFDKIIPILIKVINIYESYNICHGLINPDNIYINGDQITIGDSVRESCGFTQNLVYETIERMQALPIGKGNSDTSIDYFAMGVLIIYLIRGSLPTDGFNESDLINLRVTEGSYDIYIKDSPLTPNFKSLLKGLLCDRKTDRWGTPKIIEWLKGRKYNIALIKVYKQAYRFFAVGDNKYYNLGTLCYALWKEWDSAKKIFKDFKIVKWIETSVGNSELADRLSYTVKIGASNSIFISVDEDEIVSRSLALIDPDGGIRYKDLSVNIEGIPTALTYFIVKNNQEITNYFKQIIDSAIISIANDSRINVGRGLNPVFMINFEKCKLFIKKLDLCFGIERVIYELNPQLPCQSPLVVNYYCHSIPRLLTQLNEIVKHQEVYSIDRHIAAFIGQRIGLKKEIKLNSLAKFPEIENNRIIKSLAVLAIAQRESRTGSLKNLSSKYVLYLKNILSYIRSKTLRNELIQKLDKVAENGNLEEILNIMCDPLVIMKDQKGFELAHKRFVELEKLIQGSSNSKRIFDLGYTYGLRLAMLLSYFICTIMVAILLVRIFFE